MEIPTRSGLLVVAAASTAMLFAAPLSVHAQGAEVPISTAYTALPGDVLEISVWKEPDLQREVLVRPDGAFSFPLIGDILAQGKTIEQLRQEIRQKLSRFVPDLVVTVTVQEINGARIYVIGQVNKPGMFVVNPAVDVLQALSLAGGPTPFAALDEIKILRRDTGQLSAIRFNYGSVLKGRDLKQNIMLLPGDTVVVP